MACIQCHIAPLFPPPLPAYCFSSWRCQYSETDFPGVIAHSGTAKMHFKDMCPSTSPSVSPISGVFHQLITSDNHTVLPQILTLFGLCLGDVCCVKLQRGDKLSSYKAALLFSFYKLLHESTYYILWFHKGSLDHTLYLSSDQSFNTDWQQQCQPGKKGRAVCSFQTLLGLWAFCYFDISSVHSLVNQCHIPCLVGEDGHRGGRRKVDIKTTTHISTAQINGGCRSPGKLPLKAISHYMTSYRFWLNTTFKIKMITVFKNISCNIKNNCMSSVS